MIIDIIDHIIYIIHIIDDYIYIHMGMTFFFGSFCRGERLARTGLWHALTHIMNRETMFHIDSRSFSFHVVYDLQQSGVTVEPPEMPHGSWRHRMWAFISSLRNKSINQSRKKESIHHKQYIYIYCDYTINMHIVSLFVNVCFSQDDQKPRTARSLKLCRCLHYWTRMMMMRRPPNRLKTSLRTLHLWNLTST